MSLSDHPAMISPSVMVKNENTKKIANQMTPASTKSSNDARSRCPKFAYSVACPAAGAAGGGGGAEEAGGGAAGSGGGAEEAGGGAAGSGGGAEGAGGGAADLPLRSETPHFGQNAYSSSYELAH